ncbi:MAG: type III pantothenate kinase [Opitutales bacterium]|nr:type III pantothenate kinase [Opitutales bacterium]
MKVFTIDIGNTRAHCAIVNGGKVESVADYPSADFAKIAESLDFGGCAVSWCSVVPKLSLKIGKIFSSRGAENFQLNSKTSPLKLDVKNPEQVGQDRIAVAIGAGKFFEPPYIVADMGTAVTIDLVDESGNYAGGAIAPGLHAFTAYLSEKTAQLPLIDPKDADFGLAIGKNTVEAMHVGCVKGFCKLADGIIADLEREFFGGKPARQKTVFTGGSVGILPQRWIGERLVEPNLANIGLAMALEMISK